ncbi:MAG: single-stranded-DNA-specific exonuclease RecJ [Chloroflexota bacterium]
MVDRDPIWEQPRANAPAALYAALPAIPPLVVHLAAWRLRMGAAPPDAAGGADPAWPEAAAVQDFLYPAPDAPLPPCRLPRLAAAAARLALAVQRGDVVGIHGDYDVDGVSATAVLTTWLRHLGARVEVFLPHRVNDGYGLSSAALEDLATRGCTLVVAVDCGITAIKEASRARDLGVDLIVLDHHVPGPALPDIALLIDPKLPDGDVADHCLAAVGLAYRLCEAMVHGGMGEQHALDGLLDLVALGTIGDVCPLVGQNRRLVARGLHVLRQGRRPGVAALASSARLEPTRLSAEDVSFRLAPRLNAAGRLDDPRLAFDLLMTNDPVRAARLAEELEQLNRRRQGLTDVALKAAVLELGSINGAPKLLIATGADWHLGVVGLVAGKLAERYHRPAVALTATPGGYVGSARSIEGFDIAAALRACDDLLIRTGGHARAAGLSLETAALVPLGLRLRQWADEQIGADQLRAHLMADAGVRLKTLTPELLHAIDAVGPFGEGNRPPLLQADRVGIAGVKSVGKDGQHVQFRLRQGNVIVKGVQFDVEPTAIPAVGSDADVIFAPRLDRYRGAEGVELRVVAMRPCPI